MTVLHRSGAPALALGGVGGFVFFVAGLPLAWLLGAMAAVMAAILAGAPLQIPASLRNVMVAVLGVLLGSAFTPALAGQLGTWAGALLALAALLGIMTLAAYLVFRRLGGFDPVSAYFAGTPGGLNEMTLVGESLGADPRVLSLVHATRIGLVVVAVPLYFTLIEGLSIPALPASAQGLADLTLRDAALLTACGLVGAPLARLARLPAAALTGPMLASAAIHLAGASAAAPPVELVAAAQVVLGAAIGCRFTGLTLGLLRSSAGLSLLTTAAMLALAAGAAALLAPLTGLPAAALFLAFAPGGLTEMTLIALSLHVETAFVSAMHIARIALVVMAAPLVFRLLRARLES